MKWFLYAIALVYISIGCCSILYTTETKNYVRSIFSNMDQKILSALPFIFGILFILSASATRFPWLFRVIGLMAVIEGVVFILISKGLYDKFMDWKRSYELRVTAVPTFLFNNQLLVGAQKYEILEKLMLSNNVKRRTLNT